VTTFLARFREADDTPKCQVNTAPSLAGNPVNFPDLARVGGHCTRRRISSGTAHLLNFRVADHITALAESAAIRHRFRSLVPFTAS
jgi:hypothetical protein